MTTLMDLSRAFSKLRDGLNDFEHCFGHFLRDRGDFRPVD